MPMLNNRKKHICIQMPPPNDKQKLALEATERYVAYGGARGGGKSWFVQWKAIILAFSYPGITIMITRKTMPELRKNHINPLKKILQGIARYNKQDRTMYFPNGSMIIFEYCAHESDLDNFQGTEVDVWFADEAGQMPQEWLEKIDACVRGTNGYIKRTYYTLNPGGPSHGYFKKKFVDRIFDEDEYPEDYIFIQALCTDNWALMEKQPEYKRALEKLPPKIRAAWLEGRWDVFEGMFFEDFRISPDVGKCAEMGMTPDEARKKRLWTHVIDPFDISQGNCLNWNLYRSFDWGYSRPFSCAWWAIDGDGVLYRIMELYGCTQVPNEGVKWPVEKVFDEIYRIEHEHPWLKGRQITGVADPAIWDASTGVSIAETAAKHGVHFMPGDHKRIPGWMQCHYRLAFDDSGRPNMYVFSNCKGFIRTIPLLMYDEVKPEDLDTKQEDHIADEWRYMCMARPMTPIAPTEHSEIFADPLNQIKK